MAFPTVQSVTRTIFAGMMGGIGATGNPAEQTYDIARVRVGYW